MFGKNKYVYTCPDVIHMRTSAKKANRIVFGTTLALIALGNAYGWYLSRKVDDNLDNVIDFETAQND